jgi:hypothetical protein
LIEHVVHIRGFCR